MFNKKTTPKINKISPPKTVGHGVVNNFRKCFLTSPDGAKQFRPRKSDFSRAIDHLFD